MKDKDKIRFHMPGHKGKNLAIYKPLIDNLMTVDFTETSGTDDLYNSSSIIKDALDLLTRERNSKYSFFLTNGTTVGILATLLALTEENDYILLPKDSHKSIYHAIELNKLNPVIVENYTTNSGLVFPIAENIFIEKLKENKNIKVVVLSRPNYYGLCMKIDALSNYCNDNNIILFVDEAHGSHLQYHRNFPANALSLGAHISVNSFHKTLPSFTQASVINFGHNLNNIDMMKVLNYIEKLQSSSPSYIMLASLDITRAYIEEFGFEKYKLLEGYINNFYQDISGLDWLKIPNFPTIYEKDFSRIILETSVPAIFVREYLEDNSIYIEMISKNILVLITTTEDSEEDFKSLAKVLLNFNPNQNFKSEKIFKEKSSIIAENIIPLGKCEGKILKENIIIYPPGSYYLKAGDTITKENIKYIEDLLNSGINVYTDFNKDIYNLYVHIN